MCENARQAGACKNTCTLCGAKLDIGEYDIRSPISRIIKTEQICFSCAFWKSKIASKLSGVEIIDGFYYEFHKDVPSNINLPFQGNGRKRFYVLHNDGSVTCSNNVMQIGKIPEHLRPQLPDTGKFITRSIYIKISNLPFFKCDRKGCWDRYHCYFYDISIEAKDGPWNEIPANYQVGCENCETFLNKDLM